MQPEPGTRIWVVIAAYNEAGVIARVVGDVLRPGYNVVVVTDGTSTIDDTWQNAGMEFALTNIAERLSRAEVIRALG